MATKHVIVGGLGNLGRHLQKVLLDQGKIVQVIDRAPPEQATPQLQHASVEYVPFTLGSGSTNDLQQAISTTTKSSAPIETVYAIVTPDVQHGTVDEFERVNHKGIQDLVQACISGRVPQLVYGSSMAVTNHFVPHVNANEDEELPSMDSYLVAYDRTKRMGEDVVLQANNSDASGDLATCALRFGGIMSGPSDYMFRNSFLTYEQNNQTIYTVESEKIDSISGWDCSLALAAASERMDHVAGQAVFCTKDASQQAPRPNQLAQAVADRLPGDAKLQYLPSSLYHTIRGGHWLGYQFQKWRAGSDEARLRNLPGTPMHLYMKIALFEQTFDNARAHKLLNWFPELTWEATVDKVVEEYLQQTAEKQTR